MPDYSAQYPFNSALAQALVWTASVITGSVGQTLAVLAIAFTGFAMLTGRIDWRRGGQVVVGCFILFGAPAIASGIVEFALGHQGARPAASTDPAIKPIPVPAKPPQFDPYAGASVPGGH